MSTIGKGILYLLGGAAVGAAAYWLFVPRPVNATGSSSDGTTAPPAESVTSGVAPGPVQGIAVHVLSSTQAQVTWQADQAASYWVVQHVNADGTASALQVYMDGTKTNQQTVSDASVTLGAIYAGATAHVTIAACNGYGCSAPSGPIAVAF